jgi:hypothetical protein
VNCLPLFPSEFWKPSAHSWPLVLNPWRFIHRARVAWESLPPAYRSKSSATM